VQRIRVWNPVIAHITLLAFGTSAPPIFLSDLCRLHASLATLRETQSKSLALGGKVELLIAENPQP